MQGAIAGADYKAVCHCVGNRRPLKFSYTAVFLSLDGRFMASLISCYQGSVNRWECDENDHLNVRFFLQKTMETLHLGLVELGLVPAGQRARINDFIQSQHVRFLAEARIAAPITGLIGVLDIQENHVRVLTELRHTGTDKILMATVHDLALSFDGRQADRLSLVDHPSHAGSRGIPDAVSAYGRLSMEEALDAGFTFAGAGIVQQNECENGELSWYQYMGRISDSVPNFWVRIAPEDDYITSAETHGRAVLEYRMDFADRLKQGERFKSLSGLTGVSGKVLNFSHLIFSLETGNCVLCNTAVSITLNLQTRKSEALPDDIIQRIKQFLIQAPG